MDAGKAAAKYEKRKNAVEAVMRGEPVSVVARVHAVPQRTIFGWLAKYRAGGWHALEEGRRRGDLEKLVRKRCSGSIRLSPWEIQGSFSWFSVCGRSTSFEQC